MNFYSQSDQVEQLKAEWDNFRKGRYPDFVTSRASLSAPGEIPVFSFHNLTQDSFEAMLVYLSQNSYSTLAADEYVEVCGKTKNERLVALTFDDGNESLWTLAYPLLKKYGMKGIGFVLPGETLPAEFPRKTFDCALGDHTDDNPLCTWAELKAMDGVIDVQSHSLLHWIMFTSRKLTGFFSPRIRDKWAGIDHPVTRRNGEDMIERGYPLGTPFYEMDSRLSGGRRMYEPESVSEVCSQHVMENGGEEFFNRKGWLEELTKIHDDAAAGAAFEFETDEERLNAIRHSLSESKKLLEENLGTQVNHLCFPFTIGGEIAVKVAEEAGYKAAYWGVSAPDYATANANIKSVTRIKDDYLFRLPGDGRWSLSKIFGAKLKRRLSFTFSGKGDLR